MGSRGKIWIAGLALALAACATARDEVRLVTRRAPPEAPSGSSVELVETAVVGTRSRGQRLDVWVPLASSEEAQSIERLDVTVTPRAPHEVVSDVRGNRTLHVRAKGVGAVVIELVYRATCVERRVDRSRIEERALTAVERDALASEPEQVPGLWPRDGRGRPEPLPMRPVAGWDLGDPVAAAVWSEVYVPGLAWTPLIPGRPLGEVPASRLVVVRGATACGPRAETDEGPWPVSLALARRDRSVVE